ncbi:integrase catalytic domain-containing protein [Trichonephila clavipes]|nr:integrase catalytic domain-containing protein [Trichonephila clavipes]
MFKSDVKVTLVRAKARVVPLNPFSIHRLKPMACCIGSRLANSIVNALNLPNLRAKRLVRTVKELFQRTLGRSVLKYDELYTVLCDCESIINCRPLTYMSENPEELIPLTPSMFLIGNKNSNIEDIEELNSNSLNKRIKYRRRDGKIRTVRLKTQHGKILRPIQRIYPLEKRSNENLQRGLEESIPTVSETLSPDEVNRSQAAGKLSLIGGQLFKKCSCKQRRSYHRINDTGPSSSPGVMVMLICIQLGTRSRSGE